MEAQVKERWQRLHRDAQLYYSSARRLQAVIRGHMLRQKVRRKGIEMVKSHQKVAQDRAVHALTKDLDDEAISVQVCVCAVV